MSISPRAPTFQPSVDSRPAPAPPPLKRASGLEERHVKALESIAESLAWFRERAGIVGWPK